MKKGLFFPVMIVGILALSLTFGACSDSGGGSGPPSTLRLTGLTQQDLGQGKEEAVVFLFPTGTTDNYVKHGVYAYWGFTLSGLEGYPKLNVAFSDIYLHGDADPYSAYSGNVLTTMHDWSGGSNPPNWTGSGTFDAWLVLSPNYDYQIDNWAGSQWYFYKASNVSFSRGSATIPRSRLDLMIQITGSTPAIPDGPLFSPRKFSEAGE